MQIIRDVTLTMHTLSLSITVYNVITKHLSAHTPNEACGLLAGTAQHATQAYPIANVASTPRTHYQMEPQAQLTTMLAIEAQRQALVGIFHSHPAGPSQPSETDLQLATYPNAAYLIFSPLNNRWLARAFRLQTQQFVEIPLIITA